MQRTDAALYRERAARLTVEPDARRAQTIDLRPSARPLIFDTQNGGTGVEVFQRLRDEGGTEVRHGADHLRVVLLCGTAGSRVAFSIDVDDRMIASGLGQIRITGGEMAGSHRDFRAYRRTRVAGGFRRAEPRRRP